MKRRDFVRVIGATAISAGGAHHAFADRDKDDHDDRQDEHDDDRRRDDRPPTPAGNASGRVVVVGGGMAGATAAKFLRLWGGPELQVTLIERDLRYVSSIMSNLVLNGSRSIEGLTYRYDDLVRNYGVNRVVGEVIEVEPISHRVRLADGRELAYDRLVIAPGIEFDVIPGLESSTAQERFPHAWKAGAQTTTLRNQIRAMPSGGTFVISIPPSPYRCPPGPYERACVVADYLKRNKPGCKVIILDANPGITAEAKTFTHAFEVTYSGIIEYIPNALVESIDASSRTVNTSMGAFRGDVINPIPAQRAGTILANNGLINVDGRWAGVDVLSYESSVAEQIHILGDSAGTTQPKAGHIANAEAKVCADAIVRLLNGDQPDPSPVTNSACYSPITANTASWLTAVYRYDPVSRTMQVVPGASGEAPRPSSDNFEEMEKWFTQLMADTYS